MKRYLKSLLPVWPGVPPRLWFTLVGAWLATLSLLFKQELWPGTPAAVEWSWLLLGALLAASWCQALALAWGLTRTYTGPWSVRFLLRLVAMGFVAVSAVLLPFYLLFWLLLMRVG